MKLEGRKVITASRVDVWNSLNDTDILKACIPGCQELTGSTDTQLQARVTQKIGPVKATFSGTVTLSDIIEGSSCRISGEGKGGVAGFAKGSALVRLADHEDGTELSYEVDAKIGGKLAQLGSRLVVGVVRKIADQFFERLQAAVEEME